jgi:hypothetical protein
LTARHGPVQSYLKAVRGGFELLRRWRYFPCKRSSSINSRACSPRCPRKLSALQRSLYGPLGPVLTL